MAAAGQLSLVQCNDTDADGPLYPTTSTTYDLAALDLGPYDATCNAGNISAANTTVSCAEPLFRPIGMRSLPYPAAHSGSARRHTLDPLQRQRGGVERRTPVPRSMRLQVPEPAIQVRLERVYNSARKDLASP